ncbi:hypothetical protein ILYODFUR_020941 [Ilyodon furcidens]|uniref:Uncharacterized protein n=1 Tax=Ilyodon furcidens TaxID=33524 RepID=A0ABV0T090_9TELE
MFRLTVDSLHYPTYLLLHWAKYNYNCLSFPLQTKIDTPPVTAIGAKAAPVMASKAGQPPLTGIGSKAAPRPGGIGSAAAGQPGMEGEGMFSKILPGGAAEQAGKLGEAISGFGKKFTSFF